MTVSQSFLRETKHGTDILCFSDFLIQAALFRPQRIGIEVPERISIFGIDNLPEPASTYPPFTSIRVSVTAMGIHWLAG